MPIEFHGSRCVFYFADFYWFCVLLPNRNMVMTKTQKAACCKAAKDGKTYIRQAGMRMVLSISERSLPAGGDVRPWLGCR